MVDDDIEVVDYENLGLDGSGIADDLVAHIDVDKKIIHATHSFEDKVAAAEMVVNHMLMMYGFNDEDLMEFIESIEEFVGKLHKLLEDYEEETLHFVLLEEAAVSEGKNWIAKHAKKVEEELKDEKEAKREFLESLRIILASFKEKFSQVDHLFSVKIDEAKVDKIKLDMEGEEEELKDILDKLLKFIVVYEHLLKVS